MADDRARTRILILGAGFGGTYAAMRLDKTLAKRDDCEVTLVDRDNFILFTPMLHEVAASELDPADIVNPIRKLLRHVTFYEAAVDRIDLDAKTVTIAYGVPRKFRTLEYDHLVVGLGSGTKFFDEQTAKYAMQMKTLGDAMLLRNRMIALLESANVEEDVEQRKKLLTFVIAGGGFAGVETVGAMNDFLRDAIAFYPRLDAAWVRVVLCHHGDVLLPEFGRKLGEYTEARLREAGVDVRLKTGVKGYDGETVTLEQGEPIATRVMLWTAGVTPDPIVSTLPLKTEKGRIVTDGCMRSVDRPEVWALGDAAAVPDPHTNKPYTTTAQTAIRQGPRLARNLEAVILKRGQPKPFVYKMLGQLAAIGRRRGTAEVFGFRFSGFIAWFLWRSVYLSKLPRLEKKLRVAMAWTLDLLFSRDLVQTITRRDLERITEFGVRNGFAPPDAAGGGGEERSRPTSEAKPAGT